MPPAEDIIHEAGEFRGVAVLFGTDSLDEAHLNLAKLMPLALAPDSENARKMIGVIGARIAGEAGKPPRAKL